MKVFIEDLTFKCIIGILPFERETKQRVVINCSFKYDYKNCEFIDYSEVAKLIEKTMKNEKFELIETALEVITNKINTKYKVNNLKLQIQKPDILKNCKVSVSL